MSTIALDASDKNMVFDPVTDDQRKQFFRHGYGAHLPGYTGHCPTLKFQVGKRFGASTEEIMKELLEKKILKTGPYKPNSHKDMHVAIPREKDIRRDWKNEAHLYKAPPYILGYTGFIPGFNSKYGLTFMKAVEEGAKEWRETQSNLRARRDAMRAHAERSDPRNLLSRARADNIDIDIDHGHDRDRTTFGTNLSTTDYQVSPERPPIVGYTGCIPGAKGEVALSKRYAQAARKGLELVKKRREERLNKKKEMSAVERVLDVAYVDETGHTRA